MNSNKNSLNGLVLAGGKSMRMGQDKGLMQWHGIEQRYYIADLLSAYCKDVYISCRTDQQQDINQKCKTITDVFENAGPLGGILSAFRFDKESAWLVLACDLPLIDGETISFLIQNRNTSAIATAYQSPFDSLPEPLIAIWEPRSMNILENALIEGRNCPRKVLVNNKPEIIKPQNPNALMNANTPKDAALVQEIILKSR